MAGFFEKLGNKLDRTAEVVWDYREPIAEFVGLGLVGCFFGWCAKRQKKLYIEKALGIAPSAEQHIVYTSDPIPHTFDDRVVVVKGYMEDTGEEVPGVAYFSKTAWDEECEIQEMMRNGSQ